METRETDQKILPAVVARAAEFFECFFVGQAKSLARFRDHSRHILGERNLTILQMPGILVLYWAICG